MRFHKFELRAFYPMVHTKSRLGLIRIDPISTKGGHTGPPCSKPDTIFSWMRKNYLIVDEFLS